MTKAQDIMKTLQYASDEMLEHENIIERITGTNRIDGTDNLPQYSAGFDNKVYGMGITSIPSGEIMIAPTHKDYVNIMKSYATDADTFGFNIPSSGVPSWFTSVWTNKTITQLVQTTPFFEVAHEFQQGMFGTTNIKIPTIAITGNSTLYSEHAGLGSTGINTNWVDRQTVTLEQTLNYGDLAIATYGMAKIDLLAKLRESLATKINLDINQIGFLGYAGRRCFGLKNDPGLAPAYQFPMSASNPASSQWAYKVGPEIIADIQSLHTQITSNAGGHANPNEVECYLILSPNCYNYLNQPASANLVTISVKEYLAKTYSKMKIVMAQNYQGTGSPIGSDVPNFCQLVYSKLGGQEVALNCFSSLYQSHGVVRELSSYNEKISYTVAGTIVAQPLGIATAYGN